MGFEKVIQRIGAAIPNIKAEKAQEVVGATIEKISTVTPPKMSALDAMESQGRYIARVIEKAPDSAVSSMKPTTIETVIPKTIERAGGSITKATVSAPAPKTIECATGGWVGKIEPSVGVSSAPKTYRGGSIMKIEPEKPTSSMKGGTIYNPIGETQKAPTLKGGWIETTYDKAPKTSSFDDDWMQALAPTPTPKEQPKKGFISRLFNKPKAAQISPQGDSFQKTVQPGDDWFSTPTNTSSWDDWK